MRGRNPDVRPRGPGGLGLDSYALLIPSAPQTNFAIAALMEIPEQYQAIRRLQLL